MRTNIKSITRHCLAMLLAIAALGLASCTNDDGSQLQDVAFKAVEHDSVSLNKQAERIVLLAGGTGKYHASIADSKVASVSISKDTLRINGILEGKTYATIISGDIKRRLKISVVVPPISISDNEIRLYPRDESRFVSVAGGGDLAHLDIDDPENALQTKWNARTGILEINALSEGDATIKAIGEDGKTRTLTVKVRCNGDAQQVGVYSTTSRSLYPQMNTMMAVHRKGVGVWLVAGTRPSSTARTLRIKPALVAPKVGEKAEVNITMNNPKEFENTRLREGKQQLIVEEVRQRNVVLRGKGYKLVIPYEK